MTFDEVEAQHGKEIADYLKEGYENGAIPMDIPLEDTLAALMDSIFANSEQARQHEATFWHENDYVSF